MEKEAKSVLGERDTRGNAVGGSVERLRHRMWWVGRGQGEPCRCRLERAPGTSLCSASLCPTKEGKPSDTPFETGSCQGADLGVGVDYKAV